MRKSKRVGIMRGNENIRNKKPIAISIHESEGASHLSAESADIIRKSIVKDVLKSRKRIKAADLAASWVGVDKNILPKIEKVIQDILNKKKQTKKRISPREIFDVLLRYDVITLQTWEQYTGVQHGKSAEEFNAFKRGLSEDLNKFMKKCPPITEKYIATRDRLLRQYQAVAECRLHIERSIQFDNAISKERLLQIADPFIKNYQLSEDQRFRIANGINQFTKYYQDAVKMRDRFPNDTDLIQELTGWECKNSNEVNVTMGQFGIEVEASADAVKKMRRSIKGTDSHVAGFFSEHTQYDRNGSLTVPFIVFQKNNKETQRHEREHVKNKIIDSALNQHTIKDISGEEIVRTCCEQPGAAYYKCMKSHMQKAQDRALHHAKDELVARIAADQMGIFTLTDIFEDYDYLREVREHLQEKGKSDNDIVLHDLVERVLVQEYESAIQNAWFSFRDFMRKGNCPVEEITALLYIEPLRNWPKVFSLLRGELSPRVTDILNKAKSGKYLTQKEVGILYEVEHIGETTLDLTLKESVEEALKHRDRKRDLALFFSCRKDQITLDSKEVNSRNDIVYHAGNLDIDMLNFGKDVSKPTDLTMPKKFPKIGGTLFMRLIKTLPGEVTFSTIGHNLDLGRLKTLPEGFTCPPIGGTLFLNSLEDIPRSKLTIPETVHKVSLPKKLQGHPLLSISEKTEINWIDNIIKE